MPNKFKIFINEVVQELKKVSWSNRDELIGSTSVIILSVIFLAVFIWICDVSLSQLINILIR